MSSIFQQFNNADIHIHTNYSDGSLNPDNVIELAYKNKLELISINDHDTVNGLVHLKNEKSTVSDNYLYLLTGVELSTSFSADSHVLGYGDNLLNSNFINHFNNLQNGRINRAYKIVEKLNELGININFNQLCDTNESILNDKKSIGRLHIAKAMLKFGYVSSISEAFIKYLGAGKPAYVDRELPSIKNTVEMLAQNNVFSVLAHPILIGLDINKLYSLVKELKMWGLEGLEVYHPSADADYQKQLRSIANEFNLVCTSGSDFHYVKDDLYPGAMLENWDSNMLSDISTFMERMYKLNIKAHKHYLKI